MVIDKKLNLDREFEYFPDGGLSFAQNIIVSQDGLTIQNEPAIVDFLSMTNIDIVGFIACNDEFVLFGKEGEFNESVIYRVSKQDKKIVKCDTNWKHQGGEVFGTFTYNVANELIIAISERNSTTDCPLKVINLDRDKKIDNVDDNIYTLTPNIPKSNIVDIEYIIGNKIKKGKYNFFIKYFIDDNYETAWFPIGIPVFAYDNNDSDTKKTILNHRIQATDLDLPPNAIERYFVSYTDFYNEDDEYTNNNIKLIFEIENTVYTHFRVGYIINRQSSTEARILPKHNIKDTTVIVNNISEQISIDELTINNFNLFNVNTLCNYKNRLYLANYKEENRNSIIDKIDTSNIKVFYDYYESNISEIVSSEGDIKKLDFSQLKNQWKPKPGRAAIYNFFIHYVYPNGNYTDGIPISNISDYQDIITYGEYTRIGIRHPNELTYNANNETLTDDIYNAIQEAKVIYGDTSVYELYINESLEEFCKNNSSVKWFDVKYNWIDSSNSRVVSQTSPRYLIELENFINSNGDILYLTPVTKAFNANKLYFTGIKMYPEFIGYFISYEEPEYINIGEGLVIPANSINDNVSSRSNYDLFDFDKLDGVNTNKLKFYYPEFNIVGGNINVNNLLRVGIHTASVFNFPRLAHNSWDDDGAYDPDNTLGIIGFKNNFEGGGVNYKVNKTEIISPDSNTNVGKEGYLELSVDNAILNYPDGLQMYLGISDNKNLYLSKNKKLISLGYIKYQNYEDENINYNYGYEDVIYNYDFYRCYDSIVFFDNRGVIINETESNPLLGNGVKEFYSYNSENPTLVPHIGIVKFWHETHYPLFLKELNEAPSSIFYSYFKYDVFKQEASDQQFQYRNLVLSPKYINDLYKLDASTYDYTGKILVNYDKQLINNKLEIYNKTIRRSDVIQSESVVNSWRFFRPENYKIITENKGDINNIVGIGNYLFVHCEHSLFLFDITDSLQTLDKNVQLLQPDSFEVAYKEIFTADKGYGGIQDHISWICDEFGYVFFDKSAKKIYRYDGGQLKDMTEGIDDLIKTIEAQEIWFGNDRERNRIMINIRGIDDNVILSYNLLTGGWASTHSYISNYKFINVKDKLFIPNVAGNNLVITHYIDTKFNNFSLPVGNIDNDGTSKSFIDVVFTSPNYNKIKVLDFITYILNKDTFNCFDILSIEIFTNCCYSGILDISEERKRVSDYKKPYYDYERWNFNYFRNIVEYIENPPIVCRITGHINSFNYKIDKKLDNALMVGKYAVIRFNFKNTSKQVNIKDIHAYFKP